MLHLREERGGWVDVVHTFSLWFAGVVWLILHRLLVSKYVALMNDEWTNRYHFTMQISKRPNQLLLMMKKGNQSARCVTISWCISNFNTLSENAPQPKFSILNFKRSSNKMQTLINVTQNLSLTEVSLFSHFIYFGLKHESVLMRSVHYISALLPLNSSNSFLQWRSITVMKFVLTYEGWSRRQYVISPFTDHISETFNRLLIM